MANFAAELPPDTLKAFPLAGRTTGFAFPPPSTSRLDLHTIGATDPMTAGVWAAGSVAQPPITPEDFAAIEDPRTSVAVNWFDKVHAIPRELDFGSIITPVTRRFEIFNASDAAVSITAIGNNPQFGISLPDITVPHVLNAFASTLDVAASASLAPVGARAIAASVGAAIFDDFLTFTTSLNTARIAIAGRRAVVIFPTWEAGTNEVLEWLTTVIEAQDSTEQRISVRSFPRQIFNVRWRLDGAERRRMNLLIESLHGTTIGLPIQTEQMRLAADAAVTDTVVTVDSTTDVDLRVGELAIVYESPSKFDVQAVVSKTATTVTLEAGLLNAYTAGMADVLPLRLGLLSDRVAGARYPVTVQDMGARFTVLDNHTGAPAGSTAGWSTLDSKVFLDDFNFVDGSMSETRLRRLLVLDNNTGLHGQTTRWEKEVRSHTKRWLTKTRAALMRVRLLLLALRGQQVSFKIPTFAEDLVASQGLTSGTNTLTIENVAFATYVGSGRQFRITFTDGTSLTRNITASTELSATEEQLTLDDTWPANRLLSEISRIEFIELVRMASDSVTIAHGAHVGKAIIEVPVRQVLS